MAELIAMTQVEVADYDLGLRGKVMRAGKSHKPGLAFCTIVYGLSLVDEVADTLFSNAANGYPDAPLIIDESTRIPLPWRPGVDAVIAELADPDGIPLEMSPRVVVQSLAARYAEMDLEPVIGFEYELWLFRDRTGGPDSAGPNRECLQSHSECRNSRADNGVRIQDGSGRHRGRDGAR
ncbi:MAG: hypothetical protein U5N53_14360 [Mycobacterium sp.]|nr:hypothetical protein [Mycobacterium sp.]